ncbi:MAG TPA: hypothetical protein VNM37_15815, partial [Candidatus Dormibacteraeota bacterium]|nr:hypothetical protein [Candidatus Dormibacteraeota bacterium]
MPSFAVAGDPGFTLTVNGANFVYNSVVRWAGSVRPTTYVSPSQVTASISMADIASTGFFNITVSNAAPGGGESAPASFEVKPVPTVVYVDDDFNSGNTGGHIWNYDAFNTVQGGINRVAAGGTVYVATGSYSENVTANKAVTLFGANQGVDGCGSRGPESTISGGAGVAVNITSDNVTVDGFALTGATCVRDISKVGVAVRNNVITAGAVGLDVEQILTTALATVTVERNCVSLTTQVAGSTPTIGLLLAGAAGPQAVIIRTNGVSGAFYGYLLYSANAGVPTAIRGGTVSGVMQGVAVINLDPVTFTVYSPSTFIVDGLSMSGFSGNYPANP